MRWEKVYPEEWEQKDSSVSIPPLTKEQQELVSDNLGLAKNYTLKRVHAIMQRYPIPRGHSAKISDLYDQMLDAAWIGLCYGASGFDPSRGYKFSTYAYHWIRLFVGRAASFVDFRSSTSKFGKQHWDAPLVISFNAIRSNKSIGYQHQSLDDRFDIWDNRTKEEQEDQDHQELIDIMAKVLKPRYLNVMKMRLLERKTCRRIAREMGVTYQRVQQIDARCIEKFKRSPTFMRAMELLWVKKKELTFTDFYPDFVGKRIA